MTRIAQSTLFVALYLFIGAMLLVACGRDTNSKAGDKSQAVNVICTRCGADATIQITGDVKDEVWPKPCPSCKRSSAYPSGKCSQCGKLIPLMDPRTRDYAVPQSCSHCGKPWEPQS
ncbi:MAG TPA: hypothetical protein PLL20_05800 [Phycisphaerae bacterium]|nr:hypothetical protein [Phycisphaerae bacterium]HRR84159.1 hypothetical protein [Phycisphaerae bacterium]